MGDLSRDWRKWTRKERVASVLIVIALLIGAPALTVTNHHANGPGQSAEISEIPS